MLLPIYKMIFQTQSVKDQCIQVTLNPVYTYKNIRIAQLISNLKAQRCISCTFSPNLPYLP